MMANDVVAQSSRVNRLGTCIVSCANIRPRLSERLRSSICVTTRISGVAPSPE